MVAVAVAATLPRARPSLRGTAGVCWRRPMAALLARLLALAALSTAAAQPETLIHDGETDEEMLARARRTAVEQGYDPADVVEMGAPFPGEWDDAQDEKRCSGCMGSMLELHRSLAKAGAKHWNLHGNAQLREIPLLEAIEEACTAGVSGYGFGQDTGADGVKRAGYYHKRQQIVRTMDDKIGKAMSEMCFRLAEDGDRGSMLAEAHSSDARALAWESCVLLNRDEPKSVYFGGQMCTDEEAIRWFAILMPRQPEGARASAAAAEDEVGVTFDEYKARYGYRLQQAGAVPEDLWEQADADKNGLLSRAEIADPRREQTEAIPASHIHVCVLAWLPGIEFVTLDRENHGIPFAYITVHESP